MQRWTGTRETKTLVSSCNQDNIEGLQSPQVHSFHVKRTRDSTSHRFSGIAGAQIQQHHVHQMESFFQYKLGVLCKFTSRLRYVSQIYMNTSWFIFLWILWKLLNFCFAKHQLFWVHFPSSPPLRSWNLDQNIMRPIQTKNSLLKFFFICTRVGP